MAQRQFRSDDTSPWGEKFGNGSDGAYTPSTSTDAPIDSACTGTINTTSLTATNASFASGQVILIHQTKGTGAGQWELNKISSYVAGTITTSYPLIYNYAAGAQVLVLKQYNSVNIAGGVTLTAKAWNGTVGGILGWLCSGTSTIAGTLTLVGKGFAGGATSIGGTANQGNSATADGGASTGANGMAGGGGQGDVGSRSPGGAGAGHATSGTGGQSSNGNPGGTAGGTGGTADLVTAMLGAGGGGGARGAGVSGTPGAGSTGSGFLCVISKTITVTGTITNNGVAGVNATGGDAGGGGAGSPGSNLFKGQTVTLGSSLVTATAASGGTKVGTGGDGGASGVGRIHADYLTAISGTTDPTIDSRQDASFADSGALFFSHP